MATTMMRESVFTKFPILFMGRLRSNGRRGRRSRMASSFERLELRSMMAIVPIASPVDVGISYKGPQELQSRQAVAEDGKGDYRVVYQDSNSGLYLRKFSAAGTPLSQPVLISGTDRNDSQAVIAMNDGGEGVIAWTHTIDARLGLTTVVVQRFDAAGNFSDRSDNKGTASRASDPSVAIDAAGDYVVAYTDTARKGGSGLASLILERHVRGFVKTAAGAKVALVVDDGGRQASQPSVAMNVAGTFVVACSAQVAGSDTDIYAQRFTASGAAVGSVITIGDSSHLQSQPSVGVDDKGGFVVAYTHVRSQTLVDNGLFGKFTEYGTEVWADRFDASGRRVIRNVVARSSNQNESAFSPSAAMSGRGDYIVGYTVGGSYGPYNPADGYSTVRAVAYTGDGVLMDRGIYLSATSLPTAAYHDWLPSIAMSRAGHLVAAWQNFGTKSVGDVPGDGIFTQTFVDSPFRYTLLDGNSVLVTGGMPATFRVGIERDAGFTGAVDVAVTDLPGGMSYTVSEPQRSPILRPGTRATEYRTVTFNVRNNVPAEVVTSRLTFSTPGQAALTPELRVGTEPSVIRQVSGPYGKPRLLKGLPMTVSGSGFVQGSKVRFGSSSILVTPTSMSRNLITVTVPDWASDGFITVVRPGGTPIVSSAGVSYDKPAVTGVAQREGWAHQALAAGTVVRIEGYGFLPGTKVQFGDPMNTDPDLQATPTAIDPLGGWLTVEVPRYAVNGVVSLILRDGSRIQSPAGVSFQVRDYRNTYGFSFHNFKFNVSFPLVSDTFGEEQTHYSFLFTTPVPTTGALAFTAAAAAGLNGSGACFGMAATSLDMKRDASLINSGLGLPSGASATVNNLVGNGNLFNYIERRHVTQLSQEVIDIVLQWWAASHSVNDVYTQVRGMILSGDNPLLSLHNSLSDGHVVVGYDVDNVVRDRFRNVTSFDIMVYDPNRECTASEMLNGAIHKRQEQSSRVHVGGSGWSFPLDDNDQWSGRLSQMIVLSGRQVPTAPTLPSVVDTLKNFVLGDVSEAAGSSLRRRLNAQRR